MTIIDYDDCNLILDLSIFGLWTNVYNNVIMYTIPPFPFFFCVILLERQMTKIQRAERFTYKRNIYDIPVKEGLFSERNSACG